MATFEERRRYRDRALELLYGATDGNTHRGHDITELRRQMAETPDEEVDLAVQWLADQGLAHWVAFGQVGITPEGVARYEASEAARQETRVALVLTIAERREVEEYQLELRRAIDDYQAREDADPEVVAELEADEATLALAAKSPKPKRAVIVAILKGLGTCCLQVGISAAGNGAFVLIGKLLG
jgi:hypothetical protein